MFLWPIRKTRWLAWPLIGWDIFDFSSKTTERNSMKPDRERDLNVFYQVCVFRADKKKQVTALASDWLRHFRLLLWNRWTEFNESWQDLNVLYQVCVFGADQKNKMATLASNAETFSTSLLKPLKGIQWNLIESKISLSSTKFVFFGLISKQKWPPWLIPKKGGTLYLGAWYVALWASCYLQRFYFCINLWDHGDTKIKSLPITYSVWKEMTNC